jgi:hypothetical protein
MQAPSSSNSSQKTIVTLSIIAGVIIMIIAMLGLVGTFMPTKPDISHKENPSPLYTEPVYEENQANTNDTGVDLFLNEQASLVNASCPMMIDKITRLDNAIALPNNEFQYNYTLLNTYLASTDINYMREVMYPTILNGIKTNPALALFRDRGTTISYSYNDAEGVFMFKMSFSKQDYATGS